MTVFFTVAALSLAFAVVLLGLAQYWASTTTGRIKPTFALASASPSF